MKNELCLLLISLVVIQITCVSSKLNRLSLKKYNSLSTSHNPNTTEQWTPERLVEKATQIQNLYDFENIIPKNSYTSLKLKNNSDIASIDEKLNILKKIEVLKNITFYNNDTEDIKYHPNPIVLLISEISDDYFNNQTLAKNTHLFLKKFSKLLFKKFSLEEELTVIIIISVMDKQVNLRLGSKLREHLRQIFLLRNSVEEIIKNLSLEKLLEDFKYSQAINEILENLIALFKKTPSNLGKIIMIILVPILILIIFFSVRACLTPRKYIPSNSPKKSPKTKKDKREPKPFELDLSKNNKIFTPNTIEKTLENLEEINKLADAPIDPKNYMCVICLLSCSQTPQHIEAKEEIDIMLTEEMQIEPINILQCGHVYHYDCISHWYKEVFKECPCCRLKEAIPISKDNDRKTQFMNFVLEVQLLLNKDLELFNLHVEDKKIKWVYAEIEEASNSFNDYEEDIKENKRVDSILKLSPEEEKIKQKKLEEKKIRDFIQQEKPAEEKYASMRRRKSILLSKRY
jgi:hypothetical protein